MKVRSRPKLANRISAAAILAAYGFSGAAHAMPYYQQNEAIKALNGRSIASNPLLASTSIYADHDLANKTIYVSPSSKKVQTGVYEITATPACEILANQYRLTYAVPAQDPSEWRSVAASGPYSAYFDLNFGNYVRQSSTLDEISSKVSSIEAARAAHPNEVQAYTSAKFQYDNAVELNNKAQAAIDSYTNRLTALSNKLSIAANPEETAAIKSEIDQVRAELAQNRPQLQSDKREAQRALERITPAYSQALGAYESVIPNEKALVERLENLKTIFSAVQKLAEDTANVADKTLLKLESAGVGTASASYSIWGEEEAQLRKVLNESGSQYAVARLPIFNIRLKQAQESSKPSSVSSSLMPASDFSPSLDNSTGVSISGDTPDSTPVTNGEGTDLPVFEKDGEDVVPKKDLLSGGGSGTFKRLVSRGAYCTGDSDRRLSKINVATEIVGRPRNLTVPVGLYKPRTSNILAQAVALDYDFNLKTDPISVECRMDIDRFRSWVSSKGSSGFLFWRKSWSKLQRESIDKSGLACEVDLAETQDGSLAPSTTRVDAIRQAMMQDIAAEFVMTYAKSYELITSETATPANPGAAAERFGTALQGLCGPNVYCQVGAIVLKTGNELFGSNRGTASGSDHLSGQITRSYSERAYITKPGNATIVLTVTL